MSEQFFDNAFKENMDDLYATTGALSQAETQDFLQKWRPVQVTVPASYVNYAELAEELDTKFPGLTGEDLTPMVMSDQLKAILGDISPALVDFVNMDRRKRLREAITTYTTIGYLTASLDEKGSLYYSIPQDVEIDEEVKLMIIRAVMASKQFNQ